MSVKWLRPALALLLLPPVASASAWKQKEFVLSFWSPPPVAETTAARYQQIADARFNLALGGNGVSNRDASLKMLEMCQASKLKALVLDDRVYGGKSEGVEAVSSDYRKIPALEGYLIKDEPSVADFKALADTVAALRKTDPDHLAYVNLFPAYASSAQLGASTYEDYVKQYLDAVKPDVLSFDSYPFLRTGERADYLENLEIIRRQAIAHKTPFWAIIQAEGIVGAYRSPSETQMRSQAFTALAYGAKGILYFTYWTPEAGGGEDHFDGVLGRDGKSRARYDWTTTLNRQIQSISPLLMNLKSTDVMQIGEAAQGTKAFEKGDLFDKVEGDPAVLGVFSGPKSGRFFWIVNRDTDHSAKVHFDFNQDRVRHLYEHDLSGNTSQDLLKVSLKFPATYDVRLDAGEGRLFEVSG